MQFNQDPEWLRRMADAEANCDVTVGSVSPLQPEFLLELAACPVSEDEQLTIQQIAHEWQMYLNWLATDIHSPDRQHVFDRTDLDYFGVQECINRLRYEITGTGGNIWICLTIWAKDATHYYYRSTVNHAEWSHRWYATCGT